MAEFPGCLRFCQIIPTRGMAVIRQPPRFESLSSSWILKFIRIHMFSSHQRHVLIHTANTRAANVHVGWLHTVVHTSWHTFVTPVTLASISASITQNTGDTTPQTQAPECRNPQAARAQGCCPRPRLRRSTSWGLSRTRPSGLHRLSIW